MSTRNPQHLRLTPEPECGTIRHMPNKKKPLPFGLRLVLLMLSLLLWVTIFIAACFLKLLFPRAIKLPRRMTAGGRLFGQ